MARTTICPYCGTSARTDENKCPNCGAPNENYTLPGAVSPEPKSIPELREYCGAREIPLREMRFFIGENYTKPRAYGIFQDGQDFVVYKNKADGQRFIRYRGRDEAHAVRELWLLLVYLCRERGI